MQAAAAVVPLVDTEHGPSFDRENHGTAFFISDTGWFLTAAHVIESYGNILPPLRLFIVSAFGFQMMPVAMVTKHPTADVAFGIAGVDPDHPTRISPMTLSTRKLSAEDEVAILGAPRTDTQTRLGEDGTPESKFSFHGPDYFEGHVLDHEPEGFGFVRGPAYATSVAPPASAFEDLAGASGGPLVNSSTLHVHGIFSRGAESYSLCSDIETVLNWDVFRHDKVGNLTLREMHDRYPGIIRIAT
jgi:hypothetical protein